jgi:hypothetical protein
VHGGARGEAAMAGLDPGPDMAAAVACWVREWGKKARGGAMRLGSVWLLERAEILGAQTIPVRDPKRRMGVVFGYSLLETV